MATIYKYKVWCNTDNKWEYVWGETAPTTCPTNTAHSIGVVSIVDERGDGIVTIKEETVATGGHYQAKGFSIVTPATAGIWTDLDINFPMPISLLSSTFEAKSADIDLGDKIRFLIAPDTVIGVVIIAGAGGDTVINVSQTVIDNIQVGYTMKIGGQGLGRVTNIDTVNLTVTVETVLTGTIAVNDPVMMTVEMVPEIELTKDKLYQLGTSKIGGSSISIGTIIRASFYNTAANAKTFRFVLEYLY